MMMQEDQVSYYKGYGPHRTNGALAGTDPNSMRTPFPRRTSLLAVLIGLAIAYHLYKHLRRRG